MGDGSDRATELAHLEATDLDWENLTNPNYKEPYPYQQDLLDTLKDRNIHRLPLFWQMRLGKSPLTIWWLLSHQPQPRRILIVCPKSVIVSWKEELESFSIPYWIFNTQNRFVQEGLANYYYYHHQTNPTPAHWAITNYECLTAKDQTIHKQPWDAVILDESTRIKNPKSNISRLITHPLSFPLSTPAYHYQSPFLSVRHNGTNEPKPQLRAVLSGTPAPESDLNYFPQFKFLFGKMGNIKNYWEFRKRYFQVNQITHRYEPRRGTTKAIADYISRNAFTLTRRSLNCEVPNTYEKRFVSLPPKQKKIYKEFEKNWYSDFLNMLLRESATQLGKSPLQLETKFATVAQNYLHQMACGYPKHDAYTEFRSDHKLRELIQLLRNDLLGEKVVIWCHYLNDIQAIQQEIRKHFLNDALPTKAVILKGGQSTQQLQDALFQFRTTTNLACNYAICQTRKASMGMDLSIADTQVFFSRSWSGLVNDQAKDRLIHPDKMHPTIDRKGILTLDIICEDTIDEDLHHALIEKSANANVYKWFLKRTGFSCE